MDLADVSWSANLKHSPSHDTTPDSCATKLMPPPEENTGSYGFCCGLRSLTLAEASR